MTRQPALVRFVLWPLTRIWIFCLELAGYSQVEAGEYVRDVFVRWKRQVQKRPPGS
jgi:hypothetical protein